MAATARVIVVGFDGSDGSRLALEAAANLVGYGSTLTVVAVRDGTPSEIDGAVAVARERLQRRGILARYVERDGDAAEELLLAAREVDADVIVLGPQVGSVSADREPVNDEVVRRAECDVLLVKQ